MAANIHSLRGIGTSSMLEYQVHTEIRPQSVSPYEFKFALRLRELVENRKKGKKSHVVTIYLAALALSTGSCVCLKGLARGPQLMPIERSHMI